MKTQIAWALACLAFTGAPRPASSQAVRTFQFACHIGSKVARVTTVHGALVYAYGAIGKPELVIRQDPADPNVFYRHDTLGVKGEGQQLRFVNGRYSYVLSSRFIAAGGANEVRFLVLQGDKVVLSRQCRSVPSFEDYDQFDRLPRDTTGPFGY